ncbi:MAG: hypothetical protein MI757_01300 [Pirellulales bacterium]|nr:hypothetical protein [Pirellulales bacterium]
MKREGPPRRRDSHAERCSFFDRPSRWRKPADRVDTVLGLYWRTSLVAFILSTLLSASAQSEDTVWLRTTADSDQVFSRKGTVADFTGETLTLESGSRIPADRVVRVDSPWTPAHIAGDAAMADGDFAKALIAYQTAGREESRRWARRIILANIVACYREQNNLGAAASAFLALVKADPATRRFDEIPLVWFSTGGTRFDTTGAKSWLDSKDPVARLIGASHLVNSPDRAKALEVLEALSILPDTRIALLAQAQIWRTRIATSKPYEALQWATAIEKLPESLRAGPSFVVARAFAHHKQPERAAELYMRVPILHPKHYDLAAQSLLEAGELFQRIDRRQDANRCFREIVKRFGRSQVAESAAQKLRQK